MKKMLFVDHYFHQKTKSVDFLIDILRAEFLIETVYVDAKDGLKLDYAIPRDIDIVLIFQLDYLAPFFLRNGIPTVVIPMFDGSSNMPKAHWHISTEARFISFSLHLHERIERAGGCSLLVKYYPEVPEYYVDDFSELRAFVWHRVPETGIHCLLVNHMIGNQLKSMHIHDAPDDPRKKNFDWSFARFSFPTTVSSWFERKSDLDAILKECNVIVAPRPSEGIGMFFLEAMARGCCVLAHDMPTHNEYIMNDISGILFNKDRPGQFKIENPGRIGKWARKAVIEGRQNWLGQDCARILEFVTSALKPQKSTIILKSWAVDNILDSYALGFHKYVSQLDRASKLISSLVADDAADELANIGVTSVNRLLDFSESLDSSIVISDSRFIRSEEGFLTTEVETEFRFEVRQLKLEVCLIVIELSEPPGSPSSQHVRIQVNDEDVDFYDLPRDGAVFRARVIVPKSARGGGAVYIKFINGSLVASPGKDYNAATQTERRGVLIRRLGIFDTEHMPFLEVSAIEDTIRPWLRDEERRKHYLLWCLDNGLMPDNEDTVSKYDFKLLGQLSASTLKKSSHRIDVKKRDLIWKTRIMCDGGQLGDAPFHALMDQILESRPDVGEAFDINTPKGLASFLAWYYIVGSVEHGLEQHIHPEESEWLLGECHFSRKDGEGINISRIEYCIWCLRSDLQKAFDIDTMKGCADFRRWVVTSGFEEFPQLSHIVKTGFAQENFHLSEAGNWKDGTFS